MNINKLKISTLLASMLLSTTVSYGGVVEDSAITAAVKAKLLMEKDMPVTAIEVTTKNNEVWLKGQVDTTLQADRAIELVASMDSVSDVDYSNLKVKASSSTAADSMISAKVKGKIAQLSNEQKIMGHDLKTETNNKEVHIFGTVTRSSDSDMIVSEVKKIKNVEAVKTNITVVEPK